MSNKIWDDKSTDLTLNGPQMSITTQPTNSPVIPISPNGQTGIATQPVSVAISGVATCTFPSGSATDGTITYQWYELGGSAVGVSTRWSGQTTDTLTINYLRSPEDDGKQYYFTAQYDPGSSTGNPPNEPITSNTSTVFVLPELYIASGITTSTVPVNVNATFNAIGGINRDGTSVDASDITYQWYVDGTAVSDGTRTTTSSATLFTKDYSSAGTHSVTLPDDATNVSIEIWGGAGGYGGNDSNGQGGNGGTGRYGKFSLPDGGRVLTLYVGDRGDNNGGAGGLIPGGFDGSSGGQGGARNNSGGGGGGASGSYVYDSATSTYILAAGGGGGGGGGSRLTGGAGGSNAENWESVSGGLTGFTQAGSGGSRGGSQGNDGGGGGGGGAGYRGGSGGTAGRDEPFPPPPPPSEDNDGGGGRRMCFTGETRVVMKGSPTTVLFEKSISKVKVGDYVMNKDKTEANKVLFLEKHTPGAVVGVDLYSPTEDLEPFATYNHALYVDGKWVAVDTECFPWMKHLDIKSVENPISKTIGDDRELYNLWLTGDGTYIVNGYGTHSGLYDGGWMRQCWEQGLLKHEEVMSFVYEFGGEKVHLKHGAYLTSKLLGKFNNKTLNRLGVYMMMADDATLRKKIALLTMNILQTVWGGK